jgi:hypothetical protein
MWFLLAIAAVYLATYHSKEVEHLYDSAQREIYSHLPIAARRFLSMSDRDKSAFVDDIQLKREQVSDDTLNEDSEEVDFSASDNEYLRDMEGNIDLSSTKIGPLDKRLATSYGTYYNPAFSLSFSAKLFQTRYVIERNCRKYVK